MMKLDGFYQNRTDGLVDVLRNLGCVALANEIDAALDTRVGEKTFAQLQNDYRDFHIAHPQFRKQHTTKYFDSTDPHLTDEADIAAFIDAADKLHRATAAAYLWLHDRYPQLVNDANESERLAVERGPRRAK